MLKIEKIVPGGFGLAATDEGIFFARYVIPGELIKPLKIEKKKGVFFVQDYELVEVHPLRKEPLCPHFTTCGGCSFQMVDVSTQIEWKKEIVADSLRRLGSLKEFNAGQIDSVIENEEWAYRYRARFQVSDVVVGFFKANSRSIVPIGKCLVVRPAINMVFQIIRELIGQKKNTEFAQALRAFEIKVNLHEDACSILFIAGSGKGVKPLVSQLAKLLEEVFQTVSISISYSNNELPGRGYRLLYGNERIFSQYGQLSFEFSPLSFFQPNLKLALKVYKTIAEILKNRSSSKIIDFYSGSGVLDLFLADFSEVLGVEVNPYGYEDAIQNAFINEKKVQFLNLDASRVERLEEADTAILNPPRSGAASSLLSAIIAQDLIRTVVYLSCDPATLARDLKLLLGSGFKINQTLLIDFYPQTHHVETLVILER
jgi:23S rRNA (uracil1939-C5)-methyltransferase